VRVVVLPRGREDVGQVVDGGEVDEPAAEGGITGRRLYDPFRHVPGPESVDLAPLERGAVRGATPAEHDHVDVAFLEPGTRQHHQGRIARGASHAEHADGLALQVLDPGDAPVLPGLDAEDAELDPLPEADESLPLTHGVEHGVGWPTSELAGAGDHLLERAS